MPLYLEAGELLQPLEAWGQQRLATGVRLSDIRNELSANEAILKELECYSFSCVLELLNTRLQVQGQNLDIQFSSRNSYEQEFITSRLSDSILLSPDFAGMTYSERVAALQQMNAQDALNLFATFFPAQPIIYENSIRLSISETIEQ